MPIYRVTAPTGEVYNVTAPDGATQEQVMGYAQAQHAAQAKTGYGKAYADADVKPNGSGFLDSLLWGHGAQVTGAAEALKATIGNAADRLTGKPSAYTAQDAYRAGFDKFRTAQAQDLRDHPVKATASTMAGSILAPGMLEGGKWAAGAKTATGAALRSAFLGSLAGAVYGEGGAQPGQGVKGAQDGAILGGALGAVLPPAMAAGGKVAARVLAPVLDPLAARIAPLVEQLIHPTTMDAPAVAAGQRPGIPSTLTDPQRRAALAIQNAIERDRAAGVNIKPGVAPMHAGGENLTALYEVAAKTPGPARQMIKDAVKQSRQATFQNVESDLGSNLGGKGDYFATLEALLAKRRENAAAGMSLIGDHMVTLDPDSVLALRSDRAKAALKEAAQNGLSSPDPDIRASAANLNRLADLVLDKPSAQTMSVREAQNVSEALLSAADAAYKGGDGARGAALKTLGRAIRTNARTPERGGFSEYNDFLKRYGSDSDAKNALELGRNVLRDTADNTPEAIRRELEDMGPGVLQHYQKGVGEALLHKVRSANGDVKVMRNLLNDRNLAAKVRMAFPDDTSFARFMEAADQRVSQADINNRLMGGSQTHQLGAAAQDLAGSDMTDVVLEGLTGDVGALTRRGAKAAFKKLGLGVSPNVLNDPRANAMLGRTASNPDDLTALLNLLQASRRVAAAPRIGGAVAPSLVPAISRAKSAEGRQTAPS